MKTFVVRLHEDPGSADIPRLCGVVDEVATGLSVTFRSERELVAALKAAMGTDPPGPSRDGGDRAPGAFAPDLPHLCFQEEQMSPRIKLAVFAVPAAVLLAACSSSPKSAPVTQVPTAKAVAQATSAAPAASTAPSTAAPASAGLSGTWSGQYSGSYQGSFTLIWTQSGSKLSGTIKISVPASTMSINGTVQGDSIRFGTVGSYGITYSGKVSGTSMSGGYQVIDGQGSSGPWSASKTG